jgi:two-component system response regulator YesN
MFQLVLVDDETSVVDSLAETIPWQDIGITHVHKAYSGFEALEILKTNSIDIMITDVRMPEMNGLVLLEHVQRNWKTIKCILLSGHADFDYAQQAIRHNVYEYLLKPVRNEELLFQVERIVELLQAENLENQAYERAVKTLQENLPKIRGDLLNDLLLGRRISEQKLKEKMDLL